LAYALGKIGANPSLGLLLTVVRRKLIVSLKDLVSANNGCTVPARSTSLDSLTMTRRSESATLIDSGSDADQKGGLDGKSFDSFFQEQPTARDRRHVKRHDAATPIAVCIVAHHALALVLTGWPERKSL
jgi:hypothetical protein